MKKIILLGAFAMLAACGSSGSGVSVGADDTSASENSTVAGASTETSVAGSDDTITVSDLGDMPPKCIELLSKFLKKIEPTVSKIDWDKATLAEFETFGDTFQADADSFDKDTSEAGCDKFNLEGSDEKQFAQMTALAQSEAPGTVKFLTFLNSLADAATSSGGSLPADCDGTIAEIEPFLSGGGTIKDLTISDVSRVSQLLTAVRSICTDEESTAFFARDDVTAFVSG
jgi:hypothetical protein